MDRFGAVLLLVDKFGAVFLLVDRQREMPLLPRGALGPSMGVQSESAPPWALSSLHFSRSFSLHLCLSLLCVLMSSQIVLLSAGTFSQGDVIHGHLSAPAAPALALQDHTLKSRAPQCDLGMSPAAAPCPSPHGRAVLLPFLHKHLEHTHMVSCQLVAERQTQVTVVPGRSQREDQARPSPALLVAHLRDGEVFSTRWVRCCLPVQVAILVPDPTAKAIIKGAAQVASLWVILRFVGRVAQLNVKVDPQDGVVIMVTRNVDVTSLFGDLLLDGVVHWGDRLGLFWGRRAVCGHVGRGPAGGGRWRGDGGTPWGDVGLTGDYRGSPGRYDW